MQFIYVNEWKMLYNKNWLKNTKFIYSKYQLIEKNL